MHYEAAIFTDALHSITRMVVGWEKDLNDFEDLIQQKKDKAEQVAGLEVNLRKGSNRYNETVIFIEAAISYMKAMQAHINSSEERKSSIELKQLQKRIRDIERRYGCYFHEL